MKIGFAVAVLMCLAASPVSACPMCAETVAADNNLPHAYMYSILFMLGMPGLLFGGFGIAIYRLIKKQEAAHAAHYCDPEFAPESHAPVSERELVGHGVP